MNNFWSSFFTTTLPALLSALFQGLVAGGVIGHDSLSAVGQTALGVSAVATAVIGATHPGNK